MKVDSVFQAGLLSAGSGRRRQKQARDLDAEMADDTVFRLEYRLHTDAGSSTVERKTAASSGDKKPARLGTKLDTFA